MTVKNVLLPDIGDFKSVDVIEVLVSPGDTINKEDSLVTLESEKATMEVPSPYSGTVKDVKIKVGGKVSQGELILTMDVSDEGASPAPTPPAKPQQTAESKGPAQPPQGASIERPAAQATAKPQAGGGEPVTSQAPDSAKAQADLHAEVLVLGAGPGGYTAAFRAADLGKNVVLVERYPDLGGVCLNVGCIPSKALLHAAKVIEEAADMEDAGLKFAKPKVDTKKLVAWKNQVTKKLTGGLAGLAKRRKVTVVQGVGRFTSPYTLEVNGSEGKKTVSFDYAIIAAGSQAVKLPHFPNDDPRILDSTSALELPKVGGELLVVGGGIIGLEMATFYHAFGSKVTVVERGDGLMPGADRDLVRALEKRISKQYEAIYVSTEVTGIEARKEGLAAHFKGAKAPASKTFDHVLVAVGRSPNGNKIGAESAGVKVNERGFIPVDKQQRTNVPHIFAIGDIVGQPMLAHKATHEGKVAAEAAAGMKSYFDAKAIPSVAYTDPEVAWAGLTETEAKANGIDYGRGAFPWAASGRSLSLNRDEGSTKILFDKETNRILGIGIVGPNAGELIAEGVLAIEMGADAEDIGLTIHPHPTLSETVGFSAEAFEGTITDLYIPKRK